MLSYMKKISISPQAECVRLLIEEQGMYLHIWIHSNQPVNQILWSKMRGCEEEYNDCDSKWKLCRVVKKHTRIRLSVFCEGLMEGLCEVKQMCGCWLEAEWKCKHALSWLKQEVCENRYSQVWKMVFPSGCIHSCWLKTAVPQAPTWTGRMTGGWPKTGRTDETKTTKSKLKGTCTKIKVWEKLNPKLSLSGCNCWDIWLFIEL